eukprot:g17926.t1
MPSVVTTWDQRQKQNAQHKLQRSNAMVGNPWEFTTTASSSSAASSTSSGSCPAGPYMLLGAQMVLVKAPVLNLTNDPELFTENGVPINDLTKQGKREDAEDAASVVSVSGDEVMIVDGDSDGEQSSRASRTSRRTTSRRASDEDEAQLVMRN